MSDPTPREQAIRQRLVDWRIAAEAMPSGDSTRLTLKSCADELDALLDQLRAEGQPPQTEVSEAWCSRVYTSEERLQRMKESRQQQKAAADADVTTLRQRLVEIAGLVNTYHNDGTTLTAAETLRAIADVLGPAMEPTRTEGQPPQETPAIVTRTIADLRQQNNALAYDKSELHDEVAELRQQLANPVKLLTGYQQKLLIEAHNAVAILSRAVVPDDLDRMAQQAAEDRAGLLKEANTLRQQLTQAQQRVEGREVALCEMDEYVKALQARAEAVETQLAQAQQERDQWQGHYHAAMANWNEVLKERDEQARLAEVYGDAVAEWRPIVERAEAAEAIVASIRQLSAKWRREAADEQRVSFCADELDAALAPSGATEK